MQSWFMGLTYLNMLPSHKQRRLVVITDTFVAILVVAGLIIFPIVFSNGLEPDAGVGLVFNTLPIAFGQMPFGSLLIITELGEGIRLDTAY